MKTSTQFLGLALFGALITGCDAEPLGVRTGAEDGSLQPLFATQPVGPVTIVTAIVFGPPPFGGDFAVTEGSGWLGCSEGTFVDVARSAAPVGSAIRKTLTCTTGGAGTFTVNFKPTPKPGPGVVNGHWTVLSGTGAFANLRGQGDFSLIFTSPTTGSETLTGKIHFDP